MIKIAILFLALVAYAAANCDSCKNDRETRCCRRPFDLNPFRKPECATRGREGDDCSQKMDNENERTQYSLYCPCAGSLKCVPDGLLNANKCRQPSTNATTSATEPTEAMTPDPATTAATEPTQPTTPDATTASATEPTQPTTPDATTASATEATTAGA